MAVKKAETTTTPTPALPFPVGGFSRIGQIQAKLPLSRSKIYRDIEAGRFPRQVKIGARASAWRNDELNAYLAKLGA